MRFATIILVVLMLAIASAASFSEQQYRESFTNWMQKHSRSYASHEFNNRYTIFKKNMDYVNEWNSKGSETILGLNAFADISNEEYKRIYLGTKIDATARLAAAQSKAAFAAVTDLPTTVNWVQKGAVTAIKNQGQCGSCWSFSTTGSTEGAHQIKTGNLVSLSEQNLIDCSSSYGNQGCNGGLMDNAFKYIIANGGIDTESSYPYKAVQGKKCLYNAKNSAATLSSYTDVTAGSESALQEQTVNGPVSVAIDASHNSFQLYNGGLYYEPQCSSTQLDHGVLVVGYGTGNIPATGSSTSSSSSGSSGSSSGSSGSSSGSSGSSSGSGSGSSGSSGATIQAGSQDYWLVKNSWGTSWGVNGYIYMSRNRDNNCGVASSASQPIA